MGFSPPLASCAATCAMTAAVEASVGDVDDVVIVAQACQENGGRECLVLHPVDVLRRPGGHGALEEVNELDSRLLE